MMKWIPVTGSPCLTMWLSYDKTIFFRLISINRFIFGIQLLKRGELSTKFFRSLYSSSCLSCVRSKTNIEAWTASKTRPPPILLGHIGGICPLLEKKFSETKVVAGSSMIFASSCVVSAPRVIIRDLREIDRSIDRSIYRSIDRSID